MASRLFVPATIVAAAQSILSASRTGGKPACKAWDAAPDPRRPDLTRQPGSGPLLRLTSRLTVDADRPKWRAIDRNERRMLSHREISSRSERVSACLERCRAGNPDFGVPALMTPTSPAALWPP